MKIAIYGPSGAGKTTTSRLLAKDFGYQLIEADAEVKKLYDDPPSKLIDSFRSVSGSLISRGGGIDRDFVANSIFYMDEYRKRIEDILFYDYLLPLIQNNNDQIIDGLLPRFINMYPFDQIIYITAPEHIRIKNLMKRGVSIDRINQIRNLQKNIFKGE